ncbi:MAG TPA: hypothetical protein VKV21_08090 [Solirubrobacteraceae bacterium]|nr:hypothetical protein [Solirubrobacteraceae bacterium]
MKSGRARGVRRATIVGALASFLCAGCGTGSQPTQSTPTRATTTRATPGASRSAHWLGLNYNSGAGTGKLTAFSRFGIVYDRLGHLAVNAGQTVESLPELAQGLRTSITAGMVPDVLVSPVQGPVGCTSDPNGSTLCLPDSPTAIDGFVRGFVRTVVSIRRAFPGRRVMFEPMNEPWNWPPPPGTRSGFRAAQLYAGMLARLLPALKAAGVPLSVVYVPATGKLADSTSWLPDLYTAEPCLKPGPRSCGPIEGWNLHPYGPPASTTSGIAELPVLRRAMRSGEDNIVVSEVGFCDTGVQNSLCDLNTPTVDGSSGQTARWLTETLQAARRMHDAGWLRALIIWERSGGGWSMQLPDGALTAQGRALIRFARTSAH